MEFINTIFNWFSNITLLQIIDFIGTFAFAISGIRLASAKQFDWFGAYVVGAATAIGGGTLRDVMLDVPVFWMHDGVYLSCTGLALLWVILFRKYLVHMHNTFFIFDAVGLALFTIVGIQKTLDCDLPIWVAIVMGTMTGAAGGVIRDVLINEEPLIFRTLRDVMLDVPVFWMHDGVYLSCTGLALLWVILFRKYLVHMHNTFFIFDAVGLALFTIVGIQKTLDCDLPIWVAIVMGTMTGAAGGVIRDVLINEEPLIFRKEIYAMACVVGGIVYGISDWLGAPVEITMLLCGTAVFLTRVLAVKYSICLPTLKSEDEPEKQ